jgi:DNA-binding NarL/FixJ family response regulator
VSRRTNPARASGKRGAPALPPPAPAGWADVFATLEDPAASDTGLTAAEIAVAALLRRGLTNREIAMQLGQSEAVVKRRVSACLKKYAVPTRTRLIALLG